MREAIANQDRPEPVGFFVEVGHAQIRRHRAPVARAAGPDGAVAEEPAVAPGVAVFQLADGHEFGPEHHMRGVVAAPVFVQQAVFAFHLPKERRARVWRENVERRALHTIGLDPRNRTLKHIRTIVIESEHEAGVHLNAIGVQQRDPPGIFASSRGFLF